MDRITINGRDYRVECNWRALTGFLRENKTDSLEKLSSLDKLTPAEWELLAECCIAEGERLEGREYTRGMIGDLQIFEASDAITSFMRIFAEQSQPRNTVKTEEKKD